MGNPLLSDKNKQKCCLKVTAISGLRELNQEDHEFNCSNLRLFFKEAKNKKRLSLRLSYQTNFLRVVCKCPIYVSNLNSFL